MKFTSLTSSVPAARRDIIGQQAGSLGTQAVYLVSMGHLWMAFEIRICLKPPRTVMKRECLSLCKATLLWGDKAESSSDAVWLGGCLVKSRRGW